jgi:hypothetical protein
MEKVTFAILISLSTIGLWQFAERLQIIPAAITVTEGSWLGEEVKR